jgi:RimJ/RimL family protein N-acetyltransferase
MNYKIDYIGNQPQFAEEVARLWAKEWTPEADEAAAEEQIFKIGKRTSTSKPPFVLVAYDCDTLVGSVGMSDHDLGRRPELEPWVIGVLVKPEYRKQGIATVLIQSVLDKAKALGTKRIYLHTEVAQGLYEKLGWTFLEHTINDQELESDIYYLDL